MHNEAEAMGAFFERLCPVLEGLVADLGRGYEIVCVNDGSTDETFARLLWHRRKNPSIKILDLSRNFGKDIALTAGLDYASGAAVIPIDADLQDPPEVIPKLFAKWLEGFDVVYASRETRSGDGPVKRLTAGWFYRCYNRLAEVAIPHDTGDFRLLDYRVVEAVRQLPERNRFMKGIFSWVGFPSDWGALCPRGPARPVNRSGVPGSSGTSPWTASPLPRPCRSGSGRTSAWSAHSVPSASALT